MANPEPPSEPENPQGSPEATQTDAEAPASDEVQEPRQEPAGGEEATGAQFQQLPAQSPDTTEVNNLSLVREIPVTCSVELGRTRIRIAELLKLSRGSVIDLDRPAGEPLDLRVNGCLVARGEVVVVNDKFGIRLLDIVDRADRLKSIS